MGTQDLTDGTWVWPEGLAHYVRVHGIALPDEFVAHMAAHDFGVPPHTTSGPFAPRTDERWRQWAARQPFRPIANCYACDEERKARGARRPIVRWVPLRGVFNRIWYYVGWRWPRLGKA